MDDPAKGPTGRGADKAVAMDGGDDGLKAARVKSLRRWRTASKKEAQTIQREPKSSAVDAIENAPPISYFALWRHGLNRHPLPRKCNVTIGAVAASAAVSRLLPWTRVRRCSGPCCHEHALPSARSHACRGADRLDVVLILLGLIGSAANGACRVETS